MSLSHKLKCYNPYIFATWWCKHLRCQTKNASSDISSSLFILLTEYMVWSFMTSGCSNTKKIKISSSYVRLKHYMIKILTHIFWRDVETNIILKFLEFYQIMEMSLCHKLKWSKPYMFAAWWCKPLIFQTYIIFYNIINSLKYLRSTTMDCKYEGIRKSKFVALVSLYSRKIRRHKPSMFLADPY